MKNITILLMLLTFGLGFIGCKSDDGANYVDYDTYPTVIDLKNENFAFDGGVFFISKAFNNPMPDSDVLLIYLQVDTTNNGAAIWQQIPITMYLNDGNEVDYNFDFSKYDFVIYAGGTFDLTGSEFVLNKNFRIVMVPGSFGKNANVDYSDYNSVIEAFGIDDSHPEVL